MVTSASRLTGAVRGGPILVLTYTHAGGEVLRHALSGVPGLACTSGTGVVPLCHAALTTWRAVEGRGAGASDLAVRSVRGLAASMITVIQAGSGASRWCEIASAAPEAAESFLRVFPEAVVVCLHRSLLAVLAEGLEVYPWGLGASPFWPFAGPHPGNNVATIADYWVARTEGLLDLETRHPGRSLRVRYEDLATDATAMAGAVCEFAGLDHGAPLMTSAPGADHRRHGGGEAAAAPLGQLQERVRATIGELHARLDYPAPFAAGVAPAEVRGMAAGTARADTAGISGSLG